MVVRQPGARIWRSVGERTHVTLQRDMGALVAISVGPGFIKTPLLDGALDDQTQTYLSGIHAIGRMGESPEVATLVAFLCSAEASFLTGGYYLMAGIHGAITP